MTRESVRKAIRTAVIATLAIFIPGLLGWLNALTEWARSEGETPFPDARGLVFLGVSAIVGGVIGLVNWFWLAIEDASGHGFLRTVNPTTTRRGVPGEQGAGEINLILRIAAFIVVLFAVVALVRILFL